MSVAMISPMPKTASVIATLAPKEKVCRSSSPASPATVKSKVRPPSSVMRRVRKRSGLPTGPGKRPLVTPSLTTAPLALSMARLSETSECEPSTTKPSSARRTCQYQPE